MNDLRITDPRVRDAIASFDRADFLRPDQQIFADEDRPLDIGQGQTTSQPSLIAWTLEQLDLRPGARALEVGTGCGYQTALLSKLCAEVYSVDIVEPLVRRAAVVLGQLRCANVKLRVGDGYRGWPEAAPFDAIVVSAGAMGVPPPLVEQLAPGGTLIIPVGAADDMALVRIEKSAQGVLSRERLLAVRFVPLVGPNAARLSP